MKTLGIVLLLTIGFAAQTAISIAVIITYGWKWTVFGTVFLIVVALPFIRNRREP